MNIGNIGLYLLVGTMGGVVGLRLKIPGGIIIGSMAAVILVRILANHSWPLPKPMLFGIQVLVGIMVGGSFAPIMLTYLGKIALPVLGSTLYLMGAGLVIALIFNKTGVLDVPTAYLGTSPGGMAALVAMAADCGANATVVAAFHFFRIAFVILTAPIIFKLWNAWLQP